MSTHTPLENEMLEVLKATAEFLHFTPVSEAYATDKDRLLAWAREVIARATGGA